MCQRTRKGGLRSHSFPAMNSRHIALRTGFAALALAFAAAAPASADIRINEISSDGGNDWVELYNTGPAAADISGYVFKDQGNNNDVVVPNVPPLQPGGFYDQGVKGLGNGDTARVFTPGGAT